MRLSPEEFQEIYDQTARPLKAYLTRLVRNPALADELVRLGERQPDALIRVARVGEPQRDLAGDVLAEV